MPPHTDSGTSDIALDAGGAFPDAWAGALAAWDAARKTDRLWAKDATIWTGSDEGAWLGWLEAVQVTDGALRTLERRVRHAVVPGASEVLLIGMGGSSLAADVLERTFPRGADGLPIRILDSTEPSAVREAFARTAWRGAMIVVSSKSGSTLEPNLLFDAAFERARAEVGDDAPKHVIAITDPGSQLAERAAALGAAAIVHGDPSIGGRYSALSPFGLVPAVLGGHDLATFMRSARDMAAACRGKSASNPAVRLGAFMAVAARMGRDKCTLLLPDSLRALGAWIEQLVAESTGKNGVAVVPVAGEEPGDHAVYGDDRAFVRVIDQQVDGSAPPAGVRAIDPRHPLLVMRISSTAGLAAEFFRWEFATAVAGAMLGVNPFDQPDVEASKRATRTLTDAIERGEPVAAEGPVVTDGVLETSDPPDGAQSAVAALRATFETIRAGNYVALLAFLPMSPLVEAALQRVRMLLRDRYRVATLLGFGPRYLHSTGQAFKGGPNTGVFIQLTAEVQIDLPVPGRTLTFGAVVSAQAAGDRRVLRERGRRVLHVHLRGELMAAIRAFEDAVTAAIGLEIAE